MPSHQVHYFMDRMIFNKSYWKLHKLIDKPYLVLGSRHRVLFHDGISTVAIAQSFFPGDKDAEWAAWMHVQLDLMCSENPYLLKQLKVMANRFYRAWWRSRKNKKALRVKFSPDFLHFLAWLRKLMLARRFGNQFFASESVVYTTWE